MNFSLLNMSLMTSGTAASGSAGGGVLMMVLYMAIIFGVMYFVAVRPQRKEEKRLRTMISQMEVGDVVVTTSGFYGIVINVSDEDCIVEFGNNKNCRIPMRKSAIAEVEKTSDSSAAAPEPKSEKKEDSTKTSAKPAVKGPRAAAREAKEAQKEAARRAREEAKAQGGAVKETKD